MTQRGRKSLLSHNAAIVILAHKHPSGAIEPSQADIAITERLWKALALIDVQIYRSSNLW
jgi:DNA repair protein RadC